MPRKSWLVDVVRVVALTVALAALPSRVTAQPDVATIAPSLRGPDVNARAFPRSTGLIAATVYASARDPQGRMWLGTEDGVYVSAGGQWHRERVPSETNIAQVRDILFDSSGARWLGMRTGAFRFAKGEWTKFGLAEGVPGNVVYSIAETRAVDGKLRIVLGSNNGACVLEGERCRTLALPESIGHIALMVRAARDTTGAEELWVASAAGGAARLRNGKWTAFSSAQGLTTPDAEDIALAQTPTGIVAYIAGIGGVFQLVRAANGAERFVLIPGSPGSAYRVTWVPRTSGESEVWAGRTNGTVLRWHGGQWDSLTVDGDRLQGQVTALRADVEKGDTRAVYIGARGGRLTRAAFGIARSYLLPGRASRDYVNDIVPAWRDTLSGRALISTIGAGAYFVDTLGRTQSIGLPTDTLLLSTARAYWGPIGDGAQGESDDASVRPLIVSHRGPAWLERNGWHVMPGATDATARTLTRVQLLDGSWALIASSATGMTRWVSGQWLPDSSLPKLDAYATYSLRLTPSPTIVVLALGGVQTITARSSTFDSVAQVDRSGPAWIRSACEVRRPNGNLLFVGGDAGAAGWRVNNVGGAFQALPKALLDAVNSRLRVIVGCGADGQVYLGSSNGLVIADVNADDPARWHARAVVGREDGLPSNDVSAIGTPFHNRLWVGTEFGPAVVDLSRAKLRPTATLSFRVLDDPNGAPLANGTELPSTHDQLRVDVWLDTYHREADSRFLIEWEHVPMWWETERSSVSADGDWSEVSTRFITGIAPGEYRLRVRARDFAGRTIEPIEWHITVLPPWWRSWKAILVYVLLTAGALYALYRWRVKVLKEGTAQLVESEKRLRASESMFRALFDRALDAHLLVESQTVVGANSVAEELFGVPDGDTLQGRQLDELLPDIDLSGAQPKEIIVHRGDVAVPVQMSVTPIAREHGELCHFVLRDLTEARAAEQARERIESHLRERQRLEALGTLAGGVAHDFNNLLGVIRGNAELADLSATDAEATREHLVSIVDASDRARDLVRQILTFSRSPLPQQSRVSLTQLLQSLQPLLRRMIPSSVEIILDIDAQPHYVIGDPTQLQQIVINLASNAEYAMRSHGAGQLRMSLRETDVPFDAPPPTGRVVHLSVTDTGVGMSRDVRERVFEPFFTTKPTGEGTGLGLAVLHGVVVAHGGRVHIDSAPNEGTCVDIMLPSAKELDASSDATLPLSEKSAIWAASRVGSRLFIVDDEPAVARVFERSLLRVGYDVRVFADPVQALQAIEQAPDSIDLLLTDQTMPGLTGDALAERVRRILPSLPVLILTGFSHRLTAERVAAVGAIAVLQKPIELESLHTAVEAALSGRGGRVP